MELATVGRHNRELVVQEEGIPPTVLIALEARAAGNSWNQSAEIGQIDVNSLRQWRRLLEVRRAYRGAFGSFWWVPFLMRYFRRLASLFLWPR